MNNWLVFDRHRYGLVGPWSISTHLLSLLDVVAIQDEDGTIEFLKNKFSSDKYLTPLGWDKYKTKFGTSV